MKNPRYDGKPLLRLAECYVLSQIGELSEADRQNLEKMAPKLAEVYRVEGSWDIIIASALNLPDTFPDTIRKMWAKNQEIARVNGVTLEPQYFAEMLVDQNLM